MSLQMINSVIANRSIATHCPLCGRRFKGIESSAEHIFPKWLQRHHQLWTRRLTIPNFLGKSYKSVTVTVCARCNNARFGQLENVLSKAVRTADAFEASHADTLNVTASPLLSPNAGTNCGGGATISMIPGGTRAPMRRNIQQSLLGMVIAGGGTPLSKSRCKLAGNGT